MNILYTQLCETGQTGMNFGSIMVQYRNTNYVIDFIVAEIPKYHTGSGNILKSLKDQIRKLKSLSYSYSWNHEIHKYQTITKNISTTSSNAWNISDSWHYKFISIP